MRYRQRKKTNLHVVTELKIAREGNSLTGANESDCLEDHVGNGLPGEHVSSSHLVHDVQGDLLIGDGLDHREREREYDGEDKSDNDTPDRKASWEDLDGDTEHDEGNNTNDGVPPVGDFLIGLHETRVNVALILKSVLEAAADITAVPQSGVDDNGSERCEGYTVRDGECGRHVEGGVCTILIGVESSIGNDCRRIIG